MNTGTSKACSLMMMMMTMMMMMMTSSLLFLGHVHLRASV